MSKITYHRIVPLPRRKILTSGAALLGVILTARTGLAGVGNRGDRPSEAFSRRRDATRYSQGKLMQLSRKELTYLYNYKIDGFDDAMATSVVNMMLSNRASTRQLIRDMAGLQTDHARRQRLIAEVEHTAAMITSGAAVGDRRLLRRSKVYNRGVKMWLRYPREGSFAVPRSLTFKINL